MPLTGGDEQDLRADALRAALTRAGACSQDGLVPVGGGRSTTVGALARAGLTPELVLSGLLAGGVVADRQIRPSRAARTETAVLAGLVDGGVPVDVLRAVFALSMGPARLAVRSDPARYAALAFALHRLPPVWNGEWGWGETWADRPNEAHWVLVAFVVAGVDPGAVGLWAAAGLLDAAAADVSAQRVREWLMAAGSDAGRGAGRGAARAGETGAGRVRWVDVAPLYALAGLRTDEAASDWAAGTTGTDALEVMAGLRKADR